MGNCIGTGRNKYRADSANNTTSSGVVTDDSRRNGRAHVHAPPPMELQPAQFRPPPVRREEQHVPASIQPPEPFRSNSQPVENNNSPAPVPPRQVMQANKVLVRAQFDYVGQNSDDLTFMKGDILEVLGDTSQPWWIAKHISKPDTKPGYIPSNYVALEDDKPHSMDCFFDVSRRDADRHLLLPGGKRGTFLVRPSVAFPNNFALSVREFDDNKQVWVVKHYRIKTLDNEKGYYITSKIVTRSIQELIAYYNGHSDGLCCRLSTACPRKWVPPPFRECEVHRKSIDLIKKLGHGSFGDVWLAKWNNSFEVAIKMLKPGTMDIEAFLEEAQTMHSLSHPKIVQMLGVCTKEEPYYIITELMENGALLSHLRNDRREGGSIQEDDLIDMMAQITDGMAYLENRKYVHRDLRTANILVGQNNWVKVADFGLARVAVEDAYKAQENTKFPIKWTAPEAATGTRVFTPKSDVWSFGVLVYEMVTYGGNPYPGMRNHEVLPLLETGYRMPNPDKQNVTKYGAYLYELMLACWKKSPADRPTFKSLNDVFENFETAMESNYLEQDS